MRDTFGNFGKPLTNGTPDNIPSSASFKQYLCANNIEDYPFTYKEIKLLVDAIPVNALPSLIKKANIFLPIRAEELLENGYPPSIVKFMQFIRKAIPNKPNISNSIDTINGSDNPDEMLRHFYTAYLVFCKGTERRLHSSVLENGKSSLSDTLSSFQNKMIPFLYTSFDAPDSEGGHTILKPTSFCNILSGMEVFDKYIHTKIVEPLFYISHFKYATKESVLPLSKRAEKTDIDKHPRNIFDIVSECEKPLFPERHGIVYRPFGSHIESSDLEPIFYGGEFGKYVSKQERLELLDHCYDSVLDLSRVLSLLLSPNHPSNLGLQSLSLAIGSRATGKRKSFYDEKNNMVIIPKGGSGGNFAHNIFEYYDNLLGSVEFHRTQKGIDGTIYDYELVSSGKPMSMQSSIDLKANMVYFIENDPDCTNTDILSIANAQKYLYELSQSIQYKNPDNKTYDRVVELKELLFGGLSDTLSSFERSEAMEELSTLENKMELTALYRNALLLDSAHSSGRYFSLASTMCAYAFDAYLLDKLDKKEWRNDFLVSSEKKDLWIDVWDQYKEELVVASPCPTDKERKSFNEKFDLFLYSILHSNKDGVSPMHNISIRLSDLQSRNIDKKETSIHNKNKNSKQNNIVNDGKLRPKLL